ncbi:MAG: hypothetical protein HY746_07145 [Elusimicrobia bacterium]|nr:hypothetical protein [Elusimicrobiota bacterium]
MNYFKNDDEDKGGAPLVRPAFKKTGPLNLGKAALSLKERIKSLSKKDIAFVLVGLSVLVMAPVVEYFVSKPSKDNLLTPGFGSRDASDAAAIYEPGIHGLSAGSPDGTGEVITPLSARDPLSLILGPKTPTPAPAPTGMDLKDAVKDMAKSAYTEASKAAPMPTPVPKLQASLRGFGSFFGGGDSTRTAGLSGGQIIGTAKKASSKSTDRTLLSPTAMPGYRGVASNIPNAASKGAYEKLRNMADRAAGHMPGGSATLSLEKAAADSVKADPAAGGDGWGAKGDKIDRPSGSSIRDYKSSSIPDECSKSLAAKLACKAAEREADFQEWLDHGIKKDIIQTMLDSIVKDGIIKPIGELVKGTTEDLLGMGPPPPSFCWQPANYNPSTGAWNPPAIPDKPWSENCKVYGAVPYKYFPGGKDKAGGDLLNCLCGYGSKPTVGQPGSGGSSPSPNPNPTPTPITQNYYEKVQNALKSAKLSADESLQILAKPSWSQEDIGNLNTKMVEGMTASLKEAAGHCSDFADYISKEQKKIEGTVEFLKIEATPLSGQVASASNLTKTADEKVKKTLKTRLANEQSMQDYVKLACGETQNIDACNFATQPVNSEEIVKKFGKDMGYLSALGHDAGELNNNIENASVVSARMPKAYNNVISQADKVSGNLNGHSTSLKGMSQDIAKKDVAITDALKAVSETPTPEVIEQTRKTLNEILGFLVLDELNEQPAIEAGIVSKPLLYARAGSSDISYRDAPASVKTVDKSVYLRIMQIIGKLPEDDVLESVWWNTNNPFPGTDVQPDDPESRPLVRMDKRIKNTEVSAKAKKDEIDKYKNSMIAAKKSAQDIIDAVKGMTSGEVENPPGTGTTNPPGLTSAGVVRKADDVLKDTYGYYAPDRGRYDDVVGSKNCKSVTCRGKLTAAKGHLDDMERFRNEVGELKKQAQEPKADLAYINTRLDQLKTKIEDSHDKGNSQDDFIGNITEAERLAGIKPKPSTGTTKPPVTVIVNQNTTVGQNVGVGVNANANANADADANASNVNINKPKPAVGTTQPQPKPKAKKSFSLPMAGGTSMNVATPDNSGETVTYTGSHREGMKWLYKYEVVCTRRADNQFKIESVQRTKALFTTGITIGGPEPVSGYKDRVCK